MLDLNIYLCVWTGVLWLWYVKSMLYILLYAHHISLYLYIYAARCMCVYKYVYIQQFGGQYIYINIWLYDSITGVNLLYWLFIQIEPSYIYIVTWNITGWHSLKLEHNWNIHMYIYIHANTHRFIFLFVYLNIFLYLINNQTSIHRRMGVVMMLLPFGFPYYVVFVEWDTPCLNVHGQLCSLALISVACVSINIHTLIFVSISIFVEIQQ